MNRPLTIGFPRMMKEPGEKRVFLPEFIQTLTRMGARVVIEEGYGSRSGFTFDDYHQANNRVHMCSRRETFQQNIVMVLRSPSKEDFDLIPAGTILMTMLHYPTRPQRLERLIDKKIKSISLDSIVNDNGIRLVENMKAVAWNGLESAFDTLEKSWPDLAKPDRTPIQVLILGTGMVGKHAVEAATKLGNLERNNNHITQNGLGSIALSVGRNISENAETMEKLFRQADILVDATQRRDCTKPVVPNNWIAWLPEHAVITDLAVDPYLLDANSPVVRGVEGIPQGNLDQYVFFPKDPAWDSMVPASVPSLNRRPVTTCYSWPGIHPEACMRHYAQQLEPLMDALLKVGYDDLSLEGDYFVRALYRASLKGWLQQSGNGN